MTLILPSEFSKCENNSIGGGAPGTNNDASWLIKSHLQKKVQTQMLNLL